MNPLSIEYDPLYHFCRAMLLDKAHFNMVLIDEEIIFADCVGGFLIDKIGADYGEESNNNNAIDNGCIRRRGLVLF